MANPSDPRFFFLSNAFQETARFLDEQFREPEIEMTTKHWGFAISMVVLRVFSVELALKALILKTLSEKPEFTHDLPKLFMRLEQPIREKLDQRFQHFRQSKPSYKGETDSLADVLSQHGKAFAEWRYLDQPNLHVELNSLISVLDALWEEYNVGQFM